MTPEELRERAFKDIETAKVILAADPDRASYLVGYALEFVLKARFCTKVGLGDFPDDRKEAKRLQIAHAFTHDLDDLLKLTDRERITRGGMVNVDWAAASDWGVERRYTPVGNRSVEQVSTQIAETEKVCVLLCHYEILERLLRIEDDLTRTRGPFNLFAFCKKNSSQSEEISLSSWEILLSFWALDDEERRNRETLIKGRLNADLDSQLRTFICGVQFLDPHDERVQPFIKLTNVLGRIDHALTAMHHNVVAGYAPMPPAWVITCVGWDKASVLAALRELNAGLDR